MRNFWPISNDDWIDEENPEYIIASGQISLRGKSIDVPAPSAFASVGVELEAEQPAVFELCRFLAHDHREAALATEAERRVSILPEMKQILLLDEWHHPDLVNGHAPSQTETFQQIARVLEANDPGLYSNGEPRNNHWKNWPEGGTM